MAGIDKIIERISRDTKAQYEAIAQSAEKSIASLMENAQNEAKGKAEKIIAQAKHEAQLIGEKAVSGSKQKANQIMLAAKSDAINDLLSEALDAMGNMPDEEYFDAVLSLAVKYAGDKKGGVMYFGEKDLKRLPKNFEKKLASAGCDVSIDRTADETIESGFIMAFGDIEENCTFAALADEKRDILKEKIYKIIF